ncbi:DUF4157 domain-containing protein [Trinickia sp. YCB016]
MNKALPKPRALAPATHSKDRRTRLSTHTVPLEAGDGGTQAAQPPHLVPLPPDAMHYNPHGLPSRLRAGIEAMSGMNMSDVVVHRNSPKPAQLEAQAYARGNDIHLAPGQERYLPHEAWHVVQQRQGRVKPTTQLAGVTVNDDAALEREADAMGSRAIRTSDLPPAQLSAASRTHAIRPVVQAGKKKETDAAKKAANKAKFDQAMLELNKKIAEANQKIATVYHIKATLATDSSTTPMNPAVLISEMQTIDNLNISKTDARLSNFSSLVKEYVNAQQKSNVTPEIQTALVKSALDAAESIYISGNTQNANNKIGAGSSTLGDYYKTNIRAVSVTRRADGLEKIAKKFTSPRRKRYYLNKKFQEADIKVDLTDDADTVKRKIAKHVLTKNKRNPERLSSTSARKFSRANSGKRIVVPNNREEIHAESAILQSIRDTKLIIQQIGGTKVACLACQAYFTHAGQGDLLGDNTGYGWVSKSSIRQLGILIDAVDAAEKYLINLVNFLETRLAKLKRFTGHAGDKSVLDMEVESDVDVSDSEDESAIEIVKDSDAIRRIYEALANGSAA